MSERRLEWKEKALLSLRQMYELSPTHVSVQIRSIWPEVAELLAGGYGYSQIANHLRANAGIAISGRHLRLIASRMQNEGRAEDEEL